MDSQLCVTEAMYRKSLYERFDDAFTLYGTKVAVWCGHEHLTYQELKILVDGITFLLHFEGLKPGDVVGVAIDRSIALVAALIAVMKIGATYVPIDTSLPLDRINFIFGDSNPRLLIAEQYVLDMLGANRINMICRDIKTMIRHVRHNKDQPTSLPISPRADSTMYIMYTSGSTGVPKGVRIAQLGVINLLESMIEKPGCSATDNLLAITTISFDMAVVELFLPLLTGATLIIAHKEEVRDPRALITLMRQRSVTIMQGTPVFWQMLLDAGWNGCPRLDKIFCGGDTLSFSLANRLLDFSNEAWNMYGPTEATVYASMWQIQRDQPVVIGEAVQGIDLYVVDENMSRVAPGTRGQLCIAGPGVARGYHNRDALTAAQFLKNPFGHGQMYRTGDLAAFLPFGQLNHLGRIDDQVRVRGHRVELGEIEAALISHVAIGNAVVVCQDDRLIAYYVLKLSTSETVLEQDVRNYLESGLPAYMIPSIFVAMEELPVTGNGKIDRKLLRKQGQHQNHHDQERLENPLEQEIYRVWSEALGHNSIAVNDNFFEIGGDSIRAVRVQGKLNKVLQRTIPIAKLFECYTIRTLASYLTRDAIDDSPPTPRSDRGFRCNEKIAIVSSACRLPGGVRSMDDFWEILKAGSDTISEILKGRWSAELMRELGYTPRGGFLDSIYSYDISLFGLSPREANVLDPSQYLMLETSWEAFERAGYTLDGLSGSSTGVFIGTSNILAHQSLNPNAVRHASQLEGYSTTGSAAATMSGRISYQFGLGGPSITTDTACSSSLVAIHLACNALRQGECDLALVGGVSIMQKPGLHVELNHLGASAKSGRCRPFAAETQGTVWSKGSAAVVLKRLSDAIRDGDDIHAVISGSAVNHGGRSASLTTPSGAAQARLIRTALSAANLTPDDIDCIEAHGTGTKLGDPIEATALAEVFGPSREGREPLYIGSAKFNFGHTQAAAGLVGLLKTCQALQNSLLPCTMQNSVRNEGVDWETGRLTPLLHVQQWPAGPGRIRRAGVSAFGIGGTNAHVILEEAPTISLVKKTGNGYSRPHQGLTIPPFCQFDGGNQRSSFEPVRLFKS